MNIKTAFSLLAAASLALSGAAFAAGAKTYQVTGPVLEVTDTMIAVQKLTDTAIVIIPARRNVISRIPKIVMQLSLSI